MKLLTAFTETCSRFQESCISIFADLGVHYVICHGIVVLPKCAIRQHAIATLYQDNTIGEAAVTCHWSFRIIPPTPFDVTSRFEPRANKTRIRITTVTNLQCLQATVTYPESDTRERIHTFSEASPLRTWIALTVLY